MANTFNEDGSYNKTDWKAGDRITADKLNKIEDSLEAINNNDISRYNATVVRLDALDNNNLEIEDRFEELNDLVVDNKDELELEIYRVDSEMSLLEDKIEDSVAEVINIANTVDGKIAAAEVNMNNVIAVADANMKAQVDILNTNVNNTLNTFQNEVNTNMNEFQNEVNEQLDSYLPLSGGTMTGDILAESPDKMLGSVEQPWGGIFLRDGIAMENDFGSCGINTEGFFRYNAALKLQGGASDRMVHVDSDNLGVLPDGADWNLGSDANRWQNLHLNNTIYMDNGSTSMTIGIGMIMSTNSAIYLRGGVNARGLFVDSESMSFRPDINDVWKLGDGNYRWQQIYSVTNLNVSSDRTLKENIEYVGKAKSGLTYNDMYNFVKDDLGLATYNFIGDDKQRMNFIAQDLLVNADGTDNKIGQMIVNPVAIPTEEEIENGTPYPTLSYDSGMYTSVLAGALKEAINKIEQLEARINELENK